MENIIEGIKNTDSDSNFKKELIDLEIPENIIKEIESLGKIEKIERFPISDRSSSESIYVYIKNSDKYALIDRKPYREIDPATKKSTDKFKIHFIILSSKDNSKPLPASYFGDRIEEPEAGKRIKPKTDLDWHDKNDQ